MWARGGVGCVGAGGRVGCVGAGRGRVCRRGVWWAGSIAKERVWMMRRLKETKFEQEKHDYDSSNDGK